MRTDRPMDDKDSVRSSAGRPRDGRIDAAIVEATRDLLLETGYTALSLSAIAARAGTTTAAIYRRWSGKAQLVHEAILPAEVTALPSASGDVEGDIRALVEATRAMFDRPEVRIALPALIADTVADPDVHGRMISRFADSLATYRSRIGEHTDPTRDDGELPLLAEVVVGSAIFRIIVRHDAPLDAAWVDDLTALVTSGWTNTSHGSSPR
ncbi:TetR/AcrR family transcriptional regulator C-terminal ligand-binding domain-containing protein [Mycobacterium hodleri]|uniref:TetR-like C-terminal domain-containing protein n=1 Tax=Mycolicibacterium hodleri TaxID=49897 RepID=UPI0021F343BC|nr:TetR-like C-terminal domain-containing protein [Mycolicibacterium hodleri]MCV7135395.1 TetR/AcrR family transcriptional regulator C-terminal ligand-binding domain-containing protein [Mycolicibacterium hodleri]